MKNLEKETIKYSDLLFAECFDEETEQENYSTLELRLQKLSENLIPDSIDRTDDGEFIISASYPELYKLEGDKLVPNMELHGKIKMNHTKNGTPYFSDKNTKKLLGYFLNEDCDLRFYARNGVVKSFYAGDGDGEYHFDINVNEKMSDDEIRKELVKGFSNKFGWIEFFEDDDFKIKGADIKFWVSVDYDGDRKLIEVPREVFDLSVDVFDNNGEWDGDRYDKSSEAFEKVLENHLDLKKEDMYLEYYNLTEQDKQDCVFNSINVINVKEE